nr:hypothetical protein [Tanacetum cinerariifolium]
MPKTCYRGCSAAAHVNEKEEGFVKVKGQKNKGKKVNTKIDGIRFTKPKEKFYHEKTSSSKNTKNVSKHIGNGSLKKDDGKVHNEDSLWTRFQNAKNTSNSKYQYQEDESDEDEVFMPDDNYTTLGGRGFFMEDDDLDCFDRYEAQVYNLFRKSQAFCDNYDIRLNNRVRK